MNVVGWYFVEASISSVIKNRSRGMRYMNKRRAEGCSMMNGRKDDGALATVANLEQRKLRNLAHDGEM